MACLCKTNERNCTASSATGKILKRANLRRDCGGPRHCVGASPHQARPTLMLNKHPEKSPLEQGITSRPVQQRLLPQRQLFGNLLETI